MSANSIVILTVPAANGIGAAADVSALGSKKTILVDGSFDAILNIEASGDGVNFGPVKTAQGGGLFNLDFAAVSMRVRVSGYRSGAPTVAVGAPSDGTEVATLDVPVGNGDGVSSDISEFGSVGTIFVTTEFGGTVNVEASDDDVNWSPVTAFQGPGVSTVNLTANFIRVTRTGVGFNPGLPTVIYVAANDAGSSAFPIPFTGFSTVTIYARLTGNDDTGNGTLANPYRTMQRCVLAVPLIAPVGVNYVIDTTGIGLETLPDDYTLPPWVSSMPITFDFADPYGILRQAVTFVSTPELADAVASRVTIEAVDILAITQDPVSGLTAIQLTVPAAAAKAWLVDEWKSFLFAGAGGSAETAVVYTNTNDTLFVTLDVTPTAPLQIMDCTTEIGGRSLVPNFNGAGLNALNVYSIGFQGYTVFSDNGMSSGLGIAGGMFISAAFCRLFYPYFANQTRQMFCNACYLEGPGLDTIVYFNYCFVTLTSFSVSRASMVQLVIQSCAWTDSYPIELTLTGGPFPPPTTLQNTIIENVLISASTGVGYHFTGGNAKLTNVLIENCAGDGVDAGGVLADSPGFLTMTNVGGTANVGVGLRVKNGATVQADDATAVTGTVNDQQVGTLAAAVYPAAGNQVYSAPTAGTAAVGVGNGDGSRLEIVA